MVLKGYYQKKKNELYFELYCKNRKAKGVFILSTLGQIF